MAYGVQQTLLGLRKATAQLLDDYWPGSVTTGGTANVTDTNRTENDNYFTGGTWFSESLSANVQAKVSAYAKTTGLITFQTALASVSSATLYGLHRVWRIDQYVQAINLAINLIAPLVRIDAVPDEKTVIQLNQLEYEIPQEFASIYRLSIEDVGLSGVYYPLNPRFGYDLIPGAAKVRLSPRSVSLIRIPTYSTNLTQHLRIEGEVLLQGNLTNDYDLTYAPLAAVAHQAAAILLNQKSQGGRDTQDRPRRIQYHEAEATKAITLIPRHHRANRKIVRTV